MRIKFKDITLALVAHCKAANDWFDVVYENDNDDKRRPKIMFENVRVGSTDRTMDGSATVHRGYLMLTVVGPRDRFVNETEEMADLIADHFTYPTRLVVTGGKISVMKPPEALQGFPDKDASEWRVPVRIDYQAH